MGAAVHAPKMVQVRIADPESVYPWLHVRILVCSVVPVRADAVPKLGAVIVPHELGLQIGIADQSPEIVQVTIAAVESV